MKMIMMAFVMMITSNPVFSEINLASVIQITSITMNSKQTTNNNNPYTIWSVVGASSSVLPSLGIDTTVSSILNQPNRTINERNSRRSN